MLLLWVCILDGEVVFLVMVVNIVYGYIWDFIIWIDNKCVVYVLVDVDKMLILAIELVNELKVGIVECLEC